MALRLLSRDTFRKTQNLIIQDPVSFTNSFGNCSATDNPSIQFSIAYVYSADIYGNNINAAKVGAKIPVQSKIHFLKEGETEKEITINCQEGPLTCNKIVGDRQYTRVTEFLSSSVTFGGQAGVSQGNGIFTSTYTLQPGFNHNDYCRFKNLQCHCRNTY
jgi:hypothetical protein